MLTNTQAREAKPRDVKYEITCDSLAGFVLRVLPSGKKVFFARYRDAANKDHRHRLGLMTPAFGADEARKIAMVILAQQGAGASVSAPKSGGPTPETAPSSGSKAPTIREFARRFEQDHVDMYLKPRTAEKYRRVLRLYVLPEFGSKRMDDITPADVQRAHNKLKPMPCAANYMRCVLSVMYSKWELWDRTAYRNPATAVQRFEEREVERFLTPEERQALERVLAAAEKIRSGKPGHIGREAIWGVRLLMLTGMRRDEIRDLRWEQVAWRQKMLRLPDSKGGKRDVIVADEVMALLGAIAAAKGNPKRGLVVCSKNGKKLYSLDRSWARARKLAGLTDVHLHDLRHSVASDAIMNGVPLEVVGKMLGHKNYRTTQRYAHIADYVLRDAVNLTSKVIVRAGRSGAKAKPPKGSPTRPRLR
ncbi:site-specific integrase [Nannocystis radixulma]|uniref:Site-specific integrase n=1 Tax=Nannocystis radixulma TaxID=2995305 RepID=A0ABT5BR83_9BACT|nr:site-specific integrase [Nannocystis radixulma]MDC0676075.1 site-specific integrase [Nannocystis radixulma]